MNRSTKKSIPLKPDAFMRVYGDGSPLLWLVTCGINVVLALSPMTWIRYLFFPFLRQQENTVRLTKLIVDLYVVALLGIELTLLCIWGQINYIWIYKGFAIFGLVDVLAITFRDLIVATSLHSDREGHFILVQDPIRWFIMMPINAAQVVLCFAILYLCYGTEFEKVAITSPSTAVYYSLVTFTTLGYGDIAPKSDSYIGQLLVSAELIGFFTILAVKIPIVAGIVRVRGGGGASN